VAEGDGTAPGVKQPERFTEPAGVRVTDPGPEASPEALDVLESQGVDGWLAWLEDR
jgi:hypothetical protein